MKMKRHDVLILHHECPVDDNVAYERGLSSLLGNSNNTAAEATTSCSSILEGGGGSSGGVGVAVVDDDNNNNHNDQYYDEWDNNNKRSIQEACSCPYLQEYLPDQLELTFMKRLIIDPTTTTSTNNTSANQQQNQQRVVSTTNSMDISQNSNSSMMSRTSSKTKTTANKNVDDINTKNTKKNNNNNNNNNNNTNQKDDDTNNKSNYGGDKKQQNERDKKQNNNNMNDPKTTSKKKNDNITNNINQQQQNDAHIWEMDDNNINNNNNQGKIQWILKNPIHALHLSSQFVSHHPIQSSSGVIQVDKIFEASCISSSSSNNDTNEPPIWYGEEQEQYIVLNHNNTSDNGMRYNWDMEQYIQNNDVDNKDNIDADQNVIRNSNDHHDNNNHNNQLLFQNGHTGSVGYWGNIPLSSSYLPFSTNQMPPPVANYGPMMFSSSSSFQPSPIHAAPYYGNNHPYVNNIMTNMETATEAATKTTTASTKSATTSTTTSTNLSKNTKINKTTTTTTSKSSSTTAMNPSMSIRKPPPLSTPSTSLLSLSKNKSKIASEKTTNNNKVNSNVKNSLEEKTLNKKSSDNDNKNQSDSKSFTSSSTPIPGASNTSTTTSTINAPTSAATTQAEWITSSSSSLYNTNNPMSSISDMNQNNNTNLMMMSSQQQPMLSDSLYWSLHATEQHVHDVRNAFLSTKRLDSSNTTNSSSKQTNLSPSSLFKKEDVNTGPPHKKMKIESSSQQHNKNRSNSNDSINSNKVSTTTQGSSSSSSSNNKSSGVNKKNISSNNKDKSKNTKYDGNKNNAVAVVASSITATPIPTMSLYEYMNVWKNRNPMIFNNYPTIPIHVGAIKALLPIPAQYFHQQQQHRLMPQQFLHSMNHMVNNDHHNNVSHSVPMNPTTSSGNSTRISGNNNSDRIMTKDDEIQWKNQIRNVTKKVELWMDNYRMNRINYWIEYRKKRSMLSSNNKKSSSNKENTERLLLKNNNLYKPFGLLNDNNYSNNEFNHDTNISSSSSSRYSCHLCQMNNNNSNGNKKSNHQNKQGIENDDEMDFQTLWTKLCNFSDDNNTNNDDDDDVTDNRHGINDNTNRYDDNDHLLQCLECSFVGCAPSSSYDQKNCHSKHSAKTTTYSHILQHMLESKHHFAVTCGLQAKIYSFRRGDYVYHDVFEQEKLRIDTFELLPWLGWKEYLVQRSFDAFQFICVPPTSTGISSSVTDASQQQSKQKQQQQQENYGCGGIFWKGMKATYPPIVPMEHVHIARLCLQRQLMFHGKIDELHSLSRSNDYRMIEFTAMQNQKAQLNRCQIIVPVGFYNLGHTSAMSAVLQCLIHCIPLQQFFLNDIGYHYEASRIYSAMDTPDEMIPSSTKTAHVTKKQSSYSVRRSKSKESEVFLASELDKVFLRYFSSSIGYDAFSVLDKTSKPKKHQPNALSNKDSNHISISFYQGQPLLLSDMLHAVWNCQDMRRIARYEQRDAHVFLLGFINNIGKGIEKYYDMVHNAIGDMRIDRNSIHSNVDTDKPVTRTNNDIVKKLFEGTLRTVLVCQECGNKRVHLEPFLSLSLPLSRDAINSNGIEKNISVEHCLKQYTLPELLEDHVDCPSCGKKTPTRKQHVIGRLPTVLCLHLNRFDASRNRKFEDFVSFPSRGLNMGIYLPHWAEISSVPQPKDLPIDALPIISYDLFGTVNHAGTLDSGRYVANVKLRDQWYHCNDSFVGTELEPMVLNKESACILFYQRQFVDV